MTSDLRTEPKPADAEAIIGIVQSTGFFSPNEVDIARELVEERLAKGAEASGYHFLLMDAEDELVGYTCYGPTDADPQIFDLYWIAVKNDSQGKGVGSMLLAETEGRIGLMGGRTILVETSSRPLYAPTRAFYRSHGYRLRETRPNHYAPGDDLLLFSKANP